MQTYQITLTNKQTLYVEADDCVRVEEDGIKLLRFTSGDDLVAEFNDDKIVGWQLYNSPYS